MGCDIHVLTEALISVDDKKVWVNVDNWRFNPHYSANNEDGDPEMDLIPIYRNRNYDLFTLLAGVRDYSGDTQSVSPPKGIPPDAAPQTLAEVERYGSDGHTHSWLTLAEIRAFHETGPTKNYTGLVTPEDSQNLDNGIFPESWCQGSSNKSLVRREWTMPADDLKWIIAPMEQRLKDVFWVFSDEYDKEIEKEIRIVFFFDN